MAKLSALIPSFIFFLQAANPDDEEFNMFLFALLLLGALFLCICLVIAVVLVILSLLAVFIFIGFGALSASVLVGLHKKSLTSGFRTFVILFSTFAFALIGIGAFWIQNRIMHWWSEKQAITIGLCTGLICGLITGLVAAFLIKKLAAFLKAKLDRRIASVKIKS